MEVTRSQFTELLKKDMYLYSMESYSQLSPVYPQLFEVVGSQSAYEQETIGIYGNSFVEKPETEKITFHNPLEGYTIYSKNRTFADGIEVSMEMAEDTPPEKIRNFVLTQAQKWTEESERAKELHCAKFFNYGGYTAGHDVFNAKITGVTPSGAPTALCYDGKPLFNLSNNLRALYPGGSAAYYNGLALALSAANLETAYLLMTVTNNVDGAGRKINLMPENLIIPPQLMFTAKNILESSGVNGSANNDINPVQNLLKPIVWQYLTDTDAWFIGTPKKALRFHNRKPLTFDFWQDPVTKSYFATAIMRFGAYVKDWRYLVGSQFSTS